MRLLLTPVLVPEISAVILRPGRNQMALFRNRIVVTQAPDELAPYPSGEISEDGLSAETALALEIDSDPVNGHMLKPKLQRWDNADYISWVKAQPCCGCGVPSDDPHHIIGHGMGGMATKVHDLFVLPLCRVCHSELHRDVKAWEAKHGDQLVLLFRFLDKALGIGAIK
ncbi:DUF968 domain-containing protein [Dickeya fangzhongdai]|uniref:DUF968 domain-containing protein n=1 Tax=Dickeya fangzhongdai TaxID=1778540 RepID=UPI001ADD3EA6|nr:DUF968 domain-containing protein [Dickeya fangzhongdai]MBO8132476.1 DUF968 domain-containing protein [Dickeya fangzhongdai]